MGDYFRFFYFDEPAPTLDWLAEGFRTIDSRFRLRVDPAARNVADLVLRDDVYAEIEINTSEGDLYLEDVADLRDQLQDPPEEDALAVDRVLSLLDKARGLIAVRLTDFGSVDYDAIDPIWDWLFSHRSGLLEIDDEGYHDREGQILSLI